MKAAVVSPGGKIKYETVADIEGRTTETGEAGEMGDPGVVSTAPKIEHYDNASYERLRHFAELIGLTENL